MQPVECRSADVADQLCVRVVLAQDGVSERRRGAFALRPGDANDGATEVREKERRLRGDSLPRFGGLLQRGLLERNARRPDDDLVIRQAGKIVCAEVSADAKVFAEERLGLERKLFERQLVGDSKNFLREGGAQESP